MENNSIINHNTIDVTYKLEMKVKNLIYALVVTFFVSVGEAMDETLKIISEAVKTEALSLNLPDCFNLVFSDSFGSIAKVQVMKKQPDSRWGGNTTVQRMIDEGRLLVAGDKLRLSEHMTIGDLDRYGITRQYLIDLGFVETMTGKELTIANLNYHLTK